MRKRGSTVRPDKKRTRESSESPAPGTAAGTAAAADEHHEHLLGQGESQRNHEARQNSWKSVSRTARKRQRLPAAPSSAAEDGHAQSPTAGEQNAPKQQCQQHQGDNNVQLSSLPRLQQQLRSVPEWQQQWQLHAQHGLDCMRSSYRGQPVWLVQDASSAQRHPQQRQQAQDTSEDGQPADGSPAGTDAAAAAANEATETTHAPFPVTAAGPAAGATTAAAKAAQAAPQRQYMFAYYRKAEGTWRAAVVLPRVATRLLGLGASSKVVPISNRYPTAHHAARAADLAQLALLGPWKGMKLNFPLWEYSAAEQQAKTGTELARYFLWLKAQAAAPMPFAGCTFAAHSAAAAAAAAAAASGAPEGASHAPEGAAQQQQQQQEQQQQQQEQLHGRPFSARAHRCGMCTGCMSGRGCVVTSWRMQKAEATARSASPPAATTAAASEATAAATKAASLLAAKAEQLLQAKHRAELRLTYPEATRLVTPNQQAVAAAVVAAPCVAAAAADTVDVQQAPGLFRALSLPEPQQQQQEQQQQQQQQEQREQQEQGDAENAEALVDHLLREASWYDTAPVDTAARGALGRSAAARAVLGQYAALPLVPASSASGQQQHPTPKPAWQPQLQQQMAAAAAAAEAGVGSMVLNPLPKAGACSVCMSLQHGNKGARGSKCPIHKVLQRYEPVLGSVGRDGPHEQQQQQQQQQQQHHLPPGQDWMAALGADGVQLVGVLRDLADRVLAPELDRIKEGAGARLRMRRWQHKRRQQQAATSGGATGPETSRSPATGREGRAGRQASMQQAAGDEGSQEGQGLQGRKQRVKAARQQEQQSSAQQAARAEGAVSSMSTSSSSSDSGPDSNTQSDDQSGSSNSGSENESKRESESVSGSESESESLDESSDGSAGKARGAVEQAAGPSARAAAAEDADVVAPGTGVAAGSDSSSRLGLDPWSFVATAVLLQEMTREAAGLGGVGGAPAAG